MTDGVVLVTRPVPRGEQLAQRLRDAGVDAIAAPTIEVEEADPAELDAAVRDAGAGRFAWVVFTSGEGVRAWFRRAEALGADGPSARVAAVGDATAAELRRRGTAVDLVPSAFTTRALGDSFPAGTGAVLLARADLAGEELDRAVEARGWAVRRVDAYRVRLAEALPASAREALEAGRVAAVTFTSPSTVDGFVRLAPGVEVASVCIGPVTADAARRAGLHVAAVASPHTEEGLIAALASLTAAT